MRPACSIALAVVLVAGTGCRSPRDAGPATGAATPGATAEGMVWIAGGTFWIGCDDCGMPDALPARRVSVDGFWMDRTPVTNAEFERFERTTGYVTVASNMFSRCWFGLTRPTHPASKQPANRIDPDSV